MTVSPRFLDEIRSRVRLSDIVGRRMKLTRAGHEFKGCCPFHHEKTPSFTVNDEKEFYHCFGCGAHGDVINFVMQNDNVSFIAAVELLANEAGLQMPKQTPQEVAQAKKEKGLHELMMAATMWFEDQLRKPENRTALDYMTGRGVGEEMLRAFHVGYAPDHLQSLRSFLKADGYTDRQMLDVGLLKKSTKGGEPYVFFRERIIFPVLNRRGQVVAFGGRILPEHLRAPSRGDFTPPKYMNSTDTPLFHKGKMLYGEAHARHAAVEGAFPIVVEGYLDVMACFEAGFKGAVAPLGTALTEEQIMVLWRMIPVDEKVPVLCFDGDNAGRRAAERACSRILPLLKPNQSVKLAFLPEGEDPDTLIREKGKAAFQAVLDEALSLSEFLWVMHTKNKSFDTPEQKAGLSRTLEQEAARISDSDVQGFYRDWFRKKIWESFRKRPEKTRTGTRFQKNKNSLFPVRVKRPLKRGETLIERIVLTTILNHPSLYDEFEEHFSSFVIQNIRLDQLRQRIIFWLENESSLDRTALHRHLIREGFGEVLERLLSDATYVHARFSKPHADIDAARNGWKDIFDSMNKKKMRHELRAAERLLAGEYSDENRDRVSVLREMSAPDDDDGEL